MLRPSLLILQNQNDPTSISFTLDPRFEVELGVRDQLMAALEKHLYGCVTPSFMDMLAQVTHGILTDGLNKGQVVLNPRRPGKHQTPEFEHDCDKCTFLGHWDGHDLYHCTAQITGPTVIARFSSFGPDYKSGVLFSDQDTHLWCAKLLAEEEGLM